MDDMNAFCAVLVFAMGYDAASLTVRAVVAFWGGTLNFLNYGTTR